MDILLNWFNKISAQIDWCFLPICDTRMRNRVYSSRRLLYYLCTTNRKISILSIEELAD